MRSKRNKRKSKLPKARLQFKIILTFLATAFLCTAFQYVLTTTTVMEIVREINSQEMESEITQIGLRTLFVSLVLLVPMTMAIGIVVTFRVAGPIKRFELYLRSIVAGANPGPCRIREGDELQELCHLINLAVETLRRGGPQKSEDLKLEEGTPGEEQSGQSGRQERSKQGEPSREKPKQKELA